MQEYWDGFVKACEARGVDPAELVKTSAAQQRGTDEREG
jgi:hypothetical protein